MVGFFWTAATKDIYNVSIHHNKVKDAPWCFVGSRQQGTTYHLYGLNVSDNYILHGQGPQIVFYNSYNGKAMNNTFVNPYGFTIQLYNDCHASLISQNTTYFKSSEINFAEVDWLNKDAATGLVSLWFGQMRPGKGLQSPNVGTIVTNNTSYGSGIYIMSGTEDAIIEGNNIYNSEDVGISYGGSYLELGDATTAYNITQDGNTYIYTYSGVGTNPAITSENPPIGSRVYFYGGNMSAVNAGYQDVVNSGNGFFTVYNLSGTAENGKVSTVRWSTGKNITIKNNNIYQCQFAGLYLSESFFPTNITGNNLYGNHISTANYGSRVIRANMAILGNMFNIKNNVIRQFNGAPLYGIHLVTGTEISGYLAGSTTLVDLINITDNDIVGGGRTSVFYDPDGNHRGNVQLVPTETTTANRNFEFAGLLGKTKIFTYQKVDIADDGTVNLPNATSGIVIVSCNAEGGMWLVQVDGTVTKISGTTNTDNADTDTKLDVYDGGTKAIVKNRLGAVGDIKITYLYY
jgi:hypothetical protein